MTSLRQQAEKMIIKAEKKAYEEKLRTEVRTILTSIPRTIEAMTERLRVPTPIGPTKAKKQFDAKVDKYRKDLSDRSTYEREITDKQELFKQLQEVASQRKTTKIITTPMFDQLNREIQELLRTLPPEPDYPAVPDYHEITFNYEVEDAVKKSLAISIKNIQEEIIDEKWKQVYLLYAQRKGILIDSEDDLYDVCQEHHRRVYANNLTPDVLDDNDIDFTDCDFISYRYEVWYEKGCGKDWREKCGDPKHRPRFIIRQSTPTRYHIDRIFDLDTISEPDPEEIFSDNEESEEE